MPLQISLKDLVNNKNWQEMQNSFSEISGIGIRILEENGRLFTIPSNTPRLCAEFLRNQPLDKSADICLPTFLGGNGVVDKNLSYSCHHTGLRNFIIPLRLDENRIIGYIILGPVILIGREKKEEYNQLTEDLNISLDDLWSQLLEIKVVSLRGIKSMIKFIEDITEYAIKSTHSNLLKESGHLTKLSRIFNILLDVAFEISQADIGSIMAVNEGGRDLTIHFSRGIPEEIINNTRVKFGEGISGIAAKEDRSFLINDKIADNRIKPYLRRPYIGSSMVLPIKTEDRVVGVMNLGALKGSETKFSEENIQAITKLMHLVNASISNT